MGQEEEIGISKHRGWKWQLIGNNQNRFAHLHNIINNKGESTMKANKIFVSFVLAVLLICTMVLPASAAITRHDRSFDFDGCTFNGFATISTYSLSNVLELTYCPTYQNGTDYQLRTSVEIHVYDNEGMVVFDGRYSSSTSALITSYDRTYSSNRIYSVTNAFFVNNTRGDRAYLCVE